MAVTLNTQRPSYVQDSALLTLPSEVVCVVLESLDKIKAILDCSQTCKQWHAITLDTAAYGILWHRLFQRQYSPFGIESKLSNPFEAFKQAHIFNMNLRHGIYAKKEILLDYPMRFTIVDDSLIVRSNCVQTWDLKTLKCIKTLPAINLNGFEIGDDRFISCDPFEPLQFEVWDLKTGQLVSSMKGHTAKVTRIIWRNQWILSGSLDRTVKVWDIVSGKCLQTLEHPDAVRALNERQGKLVAGCANGEIKVWDLSSGECLRTFEVFTYAVTHLVFINEICVAFTSIAEKMKVLDLESGECLKFFQLRVNQDDPSFIYNKCVVRDRTRKSLLSFKDLYREGRWPIWPMEDEHTFTGNYSFWQNKFIALHADRIRIKDYHASDDAIFANIANGLLLQGLKIDSRLMRMSDDAQQAIYREMRQLLHLSSSLSETRLSRLFHNWDGTICTPEIQAQAIYNYLAKKGAHIPLTVRFDTGYGNSLVLCGSGGGLSWDPAQALPLKCEGRDKWTLRLPLGAEEFKLLLKTKQGTVHWEHGENRSVFGQDPIEIQSPKFRLIKRK